MVKEQFYRDGYFDKSTTQLPTLVLANDLKQAEEGMLKVLQDFKTYVEKQDF